ncbi:hypothetical protein D3C84_949080 [compost metagenome]
MFNVEAFNRAFAKAKDRQAKQQAQKTNNSHSTKPNEHAVVAVNLSSDAQYRTTILSLMRTRIAQQKKANKNV